MKILITGGTGFVGQALIPQLDQHELTLLTRSPANAKAKFGSAHTYLATLDQLTDLNGFDAVINLAGEPIAAGRWTNTKKHAICESRWQLTQTLLTLQQQSSTPPKCWINASAIGIYGAQAAEAIIDETFAITATDFASQVCQRWEQLALQAQTAQTRVCVLRISLVLHPEGGALKKMLPAFKLGLGGPMGDGKQMVSWIHREDLVRLMLFLLEQPGCQGVFNAASPNPLPQKQFADGIGRALKRPAFIPAPAFALKLLLGEMSQLLLTGQAVYPKAAMAAGFEFHYPQLDAALKDLL